MAELDFGKLYSMQVVVKDIRYENALKSLGNLDFVTDNNLTVINGNFDDALEVVDFILNNTGISASQKDFESVGFGETVLEDNNYLIRRFTT